MSVFKIIGEKFNAWRCYRAGVRELNNLSDRALDDIGVARDAIAFVVGGAVRDA